MSIIGHVNQKLFANAILDPAVKDGDSVCQIY
jgi:hypothetical protein